MADFHNVLLQMLVASCVLSILANLAIIAVILYSSRLRHMPLHALIVSIAVADLLMSSFVTPMYIRSLVEQEHPDCHTNLAVQVIGDHGVFFVVGWALVTFNIIFIIKMNKRLRSRFMKCPLSSSVKGILLGVWPWLAAVSILVPLIMTNMRLHVDSDWEDIMCMMRLPRSILILASCLSIYGPFYLCLAALVTVTICHSKGCHREDPAGIIEDANSNISDPSVEEGEPRPPEESPLVTSTPTVVYVVCYTPAIVHTWLYVSGVITPASMYLVIMFAFQARSFLLPLSWLVFRDINTEVKSYWASFREWFSTCRGNPPTSTSSSVSFSRLQETQTV